MKLCSLGCKEDLTITKLLVSPSPQSRAEHPLSVHHIASQSHPPKYNIHQAYITLPVSPSPQAKVEHPLGEHHIVSQPQCPNLKQNTHWANITLSVSSDSTTVQV